MSSKTLILINLVFLTLIVIFRGQITNLTDQLRNLPSPVIVAPSLEPVAQPSPTPPAKQQPTNNAAPANDTDPWGVAKQIDEHTWTMKVGYDDRMATPKEVFDALNVYRGTYGIHAVQWDDRLAAYAKERADYFASIENLDGHKGFMEYTDNPDNMEKLGSWSVGENASYGYRLSGVHLIEWVFAGDEGHNTNQLDSRWNKAGVGINGTAVDLIFGG